VTLNARAKGTEINKQKERRRKSIKHFIVETEKKWLIEQLQSDEMPLHMPK